MNIQDLHVGDKLPNPATISLNNIKVPERGYFVVTDEHPFDALIRENLEKN